MKSILCDYCDAYIFLKVTITTAWAEVAGDKVARRATTESEEINKGVIFNN